MRWSLGPLLVVPMAALAVVLVRRRFTLVTVRGDSMLPVLADGDRVLVRRARLDQVRRRQVVVVQTPDQDFNWPPPGQAGARLWMIKRAAALPGEPLPAAFRPRPAGLGDGLVPAGKLVVLGDNASASFDSREMGYVPGERLLGTVVRRVSHP
ncbi:MAG TPA: S26 family signal peptidase [Streptosporangiaceae bacterium]|nr:S26 family signal peptidase [Streptosporangiaceae bacterium]